ncbi:MAG: hypothetical protein QM756_07840 [Polyangiaceae bacterium]
MSVRSSLARLVVLGLLLSACAASTPKADQAGKADEKVAEADAERGSSEKDADKEAAPEGARVPAELAAMLEPRTCNPKLLTNSHFRELKDIKGQRHRAFLIAPGEELCLVGSSIEGPLADLELSDDPVPLDNARERLISVELKTLEMGSVLVVKNHHRETLQFRGSMALPNQLDLVSTSVCPVKPGRFSVEHWPDPLRSLLLTDFSLHDPNEQLGCE